MHLPALIPDDYLPNISTRLVLYKRIAQAQDKEALNDIQVEMIDRFGLLPDATKQLFIQAEVRLRAQALGISEVDVGVAGGSVKFERRPLYRSMHSLACSRAIRKSLS